jgi:hypothetical protein
MVIHVWTRCAPAQITVCMEGSETECSLGLESCYPAIVVVSFVHLGGNCSSIVVLSLLHIHQNVILLKGEQIDKLCGISVTRLL